MVLSGRRAEPLERVAGAIEAAGGEVVVEPLDVSTQQDVGAVVDRTVERFGCIDIGVFSAGINVKDRNWPVVSTEGWDQVIGIDLDGAFYCCHAVLPVMRGQGAGLIINTSSMAAKGVSSLTGPAYIAAKHAMNAMTASLLVEERNNGIRATAICPGEVVTPWLRRATPDLAKADTTAAPEVSESNFSPRKRMHRCQVVRYRRLPFAGQFSVRVVRQPIR